MGPKHTLERTRNGVIDRAAVSLSLYFIRHGETDWTLTSQHTGRTDIPLTPKGEEEARGLEAQLKSVPFFKVLTSPARRARQTCTLAGLGSVAEIEPDLAEWDYGDYEGRRSVDIHKERPDWNIFRDGCPRGEVPGQVSERADRLIAQLQTMQGNVALFSHGQIGCALAARWIGSPIITGQHFLLGTTSLSILGHDPHHRKTPVLTLWNAPPQNNDLRLLRS